MTNVGQMFSIAGVYIIVLYCEERKNAFRKVINYVMPGELRAAQR